MPPNDSDPREDAFWQNRVQDRTILDALRMYPDCATGIFGPVPVMRGDVLQLSMILAARQILSEPPGTAGLERADVVGRYLRIAIDSLPSEARQACLDFLKPASLDAIARECARRILYEATGVRPP